jgi:hypothetical protein
MEITTVAIQRTELARYPAGRPCSGLEFRLNFAWLFVQGSRAGAGMPAASIEQG